MATNTAISSVPVLVDYEGLRHHFGLKLSRVSIYRFVRDGRLPQPIRTGPGRSARRFWRRDDVEKAIAAWPVGAA